MLQCLVSEHTQGKELKYLESNDGYQSLTSIMLSKLVRSRSTPGPFALTADSHPTAATAAAISVSVILITGPTTLAREGIAVALAIIAVTIPASSIPIALPLSAVPILAATTSAAPSALLAWPSRRRRRRWW